MAKIQLVIALLMVILGSKMQALAAIDRSYAGEAKKHRYIENGTVSGGESGTAFTLLSVRRLYSPKDKIERIILDLGDAYAKPLYNHVSYFQVAVHKSEARVDIDLSQMLAAGVTAEALRAQFADSPFVKTAKIHFDPVDSTITLQLILKNRARVEAFELPSKDKKQASRIVIDLNQPIVPNKNRG